MHGHPIGGHPRGLAYLVFTEMWERFSYYGMNSLLLLYMVEQLLLPGTAGNVVGMAGLKGTLEGVFGPLSTQALASQIFGFYGGLVYLTPIIGGWLADRFFGTTRMVVAGVLLMTLGHFLMTFDHSFLAALALLILGSGALKGNIATQVGQLYPADDEARRSRGYMVFSMGINAGALFGSLACGAVAQIYGWHAGFALAGVMMLLALGVYLRGRTYLPPAPVRTAQQVSIPLGSHEWRAVLLILAVLAIAACAMVAWFMAFNAGFVWIADHVDRQTAIGTVPMAWFVSLDALLSILSPLALIVLWRRLATRGREPSDLTKIALGYGVLALCMATLALGGRLAGTGQTGLAIPVLVFVLTAVGFMCSWPVMLAFVSRCAPAQVRALMMGVAYLVAFFGSVFAGIIAGEYESMTPSRFFGLVALLPAAAGLLLFVLRGPLTRALAAPAPAPSSTSPAVAGASA